MPKKSRKGKYFCELTIFRSSFFTVKSHVWHTNDF
jgi:hypothetical protein